MTLRFILVLSMMGALFLGPGNVFSAQDEKTPAPVEAPKQDVKAPTVEIYGTSWCGFCKMARSFFKSRSIPFTEYDVEKDQAAYYRFREINPQGGVPLVVIGKYAVSGYQEDAYKKALDLSKQ